MYQNNFSDDLLANAERLWNEKDIRNALANKDFNRRMYDSTGYLSQTMLIHASIFNDYLLTSQLIQNHANLDLDDGRSKTALYYAVWANNKSILGLLIDAGANVNISSDKITPLYLAIKSNNTEIALMLIEAWANVNDLNEDKQTALMVCASNGNTIVADKLLKFGANINLKNKDGLKAFDIAKYHGQKLVEFVISKYL